MKEEFKEPYKTLCGICYAEIGESDNPEGDLSYDGCEEPEDFYKNR